MPPYGAAPSNPLASDADSINPPTARQRGPRPPSKDRLPVTNPPATSVRHQSRSQPREAGSKPAQKRMSELTASSPKKGGKGVRPFLLRSPIALSDKSNLPRGRGRAFTEQIVSSPFRAAPLPRPVRLTNAATKTAKSLAIFHDPTPAHPQAAVNLPPDHVFAPNFSLSGLLGALPATPFHRHARSRPPGLSTPFCRSPERPALTEQSLAALRSSPDGGSVIMGGGMDHSSIVLETYEESVVGHGEADGRRGSGCGVKEDNRMEEDEADATVRAGGDASGGSASGEVTLRAEHAPAGSSDNAQLSSDWEDEPTRGLGLATATCALDLDTTMGVISPQAGLASGQAEVRLGSALHAPPLEVSEQASLAPTKVLGDGAGVLQARSQLSSLASSVLSSTEPRPSPAPINSSAQLPLRPPTARAVLTSPITSQHHSPSPPVVTLQADNSSPFPPRRPRQQLAPPRPTGPLEHEDDLAYFIATTATGSSDEDENGADGGGASDASHAEDERRWRASEKEIGVGGEENRDRLEARRRKLARRKREIGQWMRRGMELRAGEGESEDEIRIG